MESFNGSVLVKFYKSKRKIHGYHVKNFLSVIKAMQNISH